MGATVPVQDNAGWLLEQLRAGLSQAVEAMTGEAPTIQGSLTGDKPTESLWWWEQPLSFPVTATVCIGSAEADLLALGEHILKAVGVEPSPQEARSTYTETIQQALGSLASSIGAKLHREVSCLPGKEFPGPPAVDAKIEISGESRSTLWLSFSPALIVALDPRQPGLTKAVVAGTGAMIPPSGSAQTLPNTMDLLLDVELPVSVSFGRAQLPLKDVARGSRSG
jgi:flagellar motor switch protein FliN/FliY